MICRESEDFWCCILFRTPVLQHSVVTQLYASIVSQGCCSKRGTYDFTLLDVLVEADLSLFRYRCKTLEPKFLFTFEILLASTAEHQRRATQTAATTARERVDERLLALILAAMVDFTIIAVDSYCNCVLMLCSCTSIVYLRRITFCTVRMLNRAFAISGNTNGSLLR